MALIVRLLGAEATNAGTLTGLYTVSSPALGAIVDNVRLVNTGGSSVTVNLFVKPSGGSQVRILDQDKSVPPGIGSALVIKPELVLSVGDAIEVTTSAAMDYVVSGMERI
jgi:hypothetical protein